MTTPLTPEELRILSKAYTDEVELGLKKNAEANQLAADLRAARERMRAEETEKWIDLYTKSQAENAKLRAVAEAARATAADFAGDKHPNLEWLREALAALDQQSPTDEGETT